MSLTTEQQAVVDYLKGLTQDQLYTDDSLVLVNAVAGAGKTFLLTQIVEELGLRNVTYLAYNKSIAEEAEEKFPSSVECATIHSMAYRHTVRPYGLKLGYLTPYELRIPGKSYEAKVMLLEHLREFCLSEYLKFSDYAKSRQLSEENTKIITKLLNQMGEGELTCTHDFYLKYFHILLAEGEIDLGKTDLLMIDEAGDLTAVTLAIFELIPAGIKLAVGDNNQNIYGFNFTINAFEKLEGRGKLFPLTKSFRVSADIADRIEHFCKGYLDPNMQFKGQEGIDTEDIRTTAFISRTNSCLINAMVELTDNNEPFITVRRPQDIFRLPLILCFLRYQGTIKDSEYKHLQKDVDEWYETPELKQQFKTPAAYIRTLYKDIQIQQACSLLFTHGKSKILDIYNSVKAADNDKSITTILTTAHSVKGLEYDRVVIMDDLNQKAAEAKSSFDTHGFLNQEEREELCLYYVACSRAKKKLVNAISL